MVLRAMEIGNSVLSGGDCVGGGAATARIAIGSSSRLMKDTWPSIKDSLTTGTVPSVHYHINIGSGIKSDNSSVIRWFNKTNHHHRIKRGWRGIRLKQYARQLWPEVLQVTRYSTLRFDSLVTMMSPISICGRLFLSRSNTITLYSPLVTVHTVLSEG